MEQQSTGRNSAYNLLDERWIPVTRCDGTTGDVSLTELLTDASDIKTIWGELPQMKFAIVRLALAILYRMQEMPDAPWRKLVELWSSMWESGEFDREYLLGYLEAVHDRFYLFDDEAPFYQVAGLSPSKDDGLRPASDIVLDVPKSNHFLFSMKAPQCAETLTYAEAARYLVMAQAYDIAGNKSPVKGNSRVKDGKVTTPKGRLGTGWCGAIGGVLLEGESLFQDLMLNWVLFNPITHTSMVDVPGDLPPWEREPDGSDEVNREPRGPVDLLTWQSRRIRLVRDPEQELVTGVVLCYGDVPTVPDKQAVEMMTAWGEDFRQKKHGLSHIPWMPRKHDPRKALWRGLPALISYDAGGDGGADLTPGVVKWVRKLARDGRCPLSDDAPFSIHALGVSYDSYKSVVQDAIDDSVSMNMLLLRVDADARKRVLDVVSRTDKAVDALACLAARIEWSKGRQDKPSKGAKQSKVVKAASKRKWEEDVAEAVKDDVREQAYEELDQLFRDRLAAFTPEKDPYTYYREWCEESRRLIWDRARAYVAESGTSLFAERDGMTAGQALVLFESALNKIFKHVPADKQHTGEESAGGEDHV